MEDFTQMPTPLLQEKFNSERERIFERLMYAHPLSNESLQLLFRELKAMNDELEKRINQGPIIASNNPS
jgi:hypothetical protein